jgi:hypothetical protein
VTEQISVLHCEIHINRLTKIKKPHQQQEVSAIRGQPKYNTHILHFMDIIQYMETVGEVEVHKGESTAALVQVH